MLKYALEQRIFLYDSYVKQKQQTLPNNLKVLKYEDRRIYTFSTLPAPQNEKHFTKFCISFTGHESQPFRTIIKTISCFNLFPSSLLSSWEFQEMFHTH